MAYRRSDRAQAYVECKGRYVKNPETGCVFDLTPPLLARLKEGKLAECTLQGEYIFADKGTVSDMGSFDDTPAEKVRVPREQDSVAPKLTPEQVAAIEARPASDPADIGIAAEEVDAIKEVAEKTDADLEKLKSLGEDD